MTPPSAASVTSSLGGADELAGEALDARAPRPGGARPRPRTAGARVARAHAGAAADEAAEVGGLGQRALDAGRGDLQRVALAQVVEQQRDALAQRQRDAVGMVDEHAQRAAAEHLGEQHLDVGLAVRETPLDICLHGCHRIAPLRKKSGRAPTFGTAAGVCTPARKLSVEHSIGRAREQLCLHGGASTRSRALRRVASRRARSRYSAVVLALGAQRARQRERLAGLAMAPQQLHRAAEAEQRVVVGRRARGDRAGTPRRRPRSAGRETARARAPRGSRPCRAPGRAPCSAARSRPGGRRGRAARSHAGRGRRRSPSATAQVVRRAALAQALRRRRGSPRRPAPCSPARTSLGAVGRRQPSGGEDRDLVGVGVEADVRARDVVDDDRVDALLGSLRRAQLDGVLAVLGGEADERLPVAPPRRPAPASTSAVASSSSSRPSRPAFLILPVVRGARAEVRDGGGHQQHVAGGELLLARSLQLRGGDDVAARDRRAGAAARRWPRPASPRRRARARPRRAPGPCAPRSCCRGSARCRSARACRRR